MNRIIGASISTAILHVLGTTLFFTRMPWTYYLIGALLQFGFVVIIRFSYRVLLVEKKRLRNRGKIGAVVIGSGENGRRVVKNLEDSEVYRSIAVIGTGTVMDGIPIHPFTALSSVVKDASAIFIADPLLNTEERAEIKRAAEDREIHEYTGFFSNLGGRLSLTEPLSVIDGKIVVVIDGVEKTFSSGEEALESLVGGYEIKGSQW